MKGPDRVTVFNHGVITGICASVLFTDVAIYLHGGIKGEYNGRQVALIALLACATALLAAWRGIAKKL